MSGCTFSARNGYGFPSSAGGGRVGACGSTPTPRYPPTDTTGITECVQNLIVRNRLQTSHIISGDTTLMGRPNDPYDIALCVKTGASVAGYSQHGQLRVLGSSCLTGPLSVSDVYGPVTVVYNPELDNAGGTVFEVVGPTAVTSLESGAIDTGTLAVAGQFTVGGFLAGPLSTAELLARVGDAIVAITNGTYTITGVAIGSHTVITTSDWQLSDTPLVLSSTVRVVVPRATGGNVTVAGTVTSIMPTGIAALITISSTAGFAFLHPVTLTDYPDSEDTPEVGVPVLVGVVNADTGARSYISGAVADSSLQMFSEFTSLAITTTGHIGTTGAAGSPIFDYRGRLLAILQTGQTNTTLTGNYITQLTGIKGRYLSYFVNEATAAPGSTIELPVAANSTVARGITLMERLSTLHAGGVSTEVYATATTPTTQLLAITAPVLGTVQLGILAQNRPSLSDALLVATRLNSSGTAITLHGAVPTSITTIDQTVVYTPAYWTSAGPPQSLCLSIAVPGEQRSTNFAATLQSPPATLLQSTVIPITGVTNCQPFGPALTAVDGEFAAFTHGNGLDPQLHSTVIFVWGSRYGVDAWLTGIGGFVKAAWDVVKSGVTSAQIIVAGGHDSTDPNGFVFVLANSPPNDATLRTTVPGTIDTATTINVAVDGTAISTTFDLTPNTYNTFSFTTNNRCTTVPVANGSTSVAYAISTPTVTALDTTADPPTTVYP